MFFLDGFDSTLSDQRVFPSRRVVNRMYIGGVITRKTVIQGKGVSTTIFFRSHPSDNRDAVMVSTHSHLMSFIV
jgi:hypothetical protein